MSESQGDGKLVTIGRFYDPTEAHLFRSILESHGIRSAVIGEYAASWLPNMSLFASGAAGSVCLQVRAEDEEQATAILENEGGDEVSALGADPLRIGVFGGTFDPVHNAHIESACTAIAEAALDLVLFVVAARPPHKQDETFASPEDRLAMAQAAVENEPNMEVSGIELEREGPSFTADTLLVLEETYPNAEFSLIVGLDSLTDLPTWKDPETILELAHVLVVPRHGDGLDLPSALEGHYTLVPFAESELSSTEVRRRIGAGVTINDCVPETVAQLIQERGIYGTHLSDRSGQ